MKELIDLQEKILAAASDDLPEEGIHFSSEEGIDGLECLPTSFQAEVTSLQETLNGLVPEDFDYYVILGLAAAPPKFGLSFDESPAGSMEDGTFDAERSLFDQLRLLNWEKREQIAWKNAVIFERLMRYIKRTSTPLPSAKQLQRTFREETRDFIKEKRGDLSKIHLMYWEEAGGLMELDFPGSDALREALPDLVGEGAEIVTVVAGGKPLPVERIDALKVEALKIFGDRPMPGFEKTLDVEAVEVPPV